MGSPPSHGANEPVPPFSLSTPPPVNSLRTCHLPDAGDFPKFAILNREAKFKKGADTCAFPFWRKASGISNNFSQMIENGRLRFNSLTRADLHPQSTLNRKKTMENRKKYAKSKTTWAVPKTICHLDRSAAERPAVPWSVQHHPGNAVRRY
jgi:hypothetical protein